MFSFIKCLFSVNSKQEVQDQTLLILHLRLIITPKQCRLMKKAQSTHKEGTCYSNKIIYVNVDKSSTTTTKLIKLIFQDKIFQCTENMLSFL